MYALDALITLTSRLASIDFWNQQCLLTKMLTVYARLRERFLRTTNKSHRISHELTLFDIVARVV